MKRMRAPLLALALCASGANAQTKPDSTVQKDTVFVQTDVMSNYLARGMEFGHGTSYQPSITAIHGPFIGFAWLNKDQTAGWNELDIYAKAQKEFGKVHGEIALGTYVLPKIQGRKHTEEVTAYFRRGNASAFIAHDFGFIHGQYGEIAFEHAAAVQTTIGAVKRQLPIAARTALAFNRNYLREGSGISHLEAKLVAPLKIRGVEITPTLVYNHPLSSNFTHQRAYGVTVRKQF